MQAHASAAIVNFSENCDQDLLPPYLDTLISKLLTLLQNGQRIVQVRARTQDPGPPLVTLLSGDINDLKERSAGAGGEAGMGGMDASLKRLMSKGWA